MKKKKKNINFQMIFYTKACLIDIKWLVNLRIDVNELKKKKLKFFKYVLNDVHETLSNCYKFQ